jgi:hypothetical protein
VSWRDVEAGIGRGAALAAAGAVALGAAAFLSGLGAGAAPRTYGALIASWIFFAGAAAGAVAFRAFFAMLGARWVRPLSVLGGAQAAFLPAAGLLLLVILAGAGRAPWVAEPHGWLSPGVLGARQLILNALLFGLAWVGLRGAGAEPSRRTAVIYCLVFSVVLSAWSFDFVLAPDPVFGSTMAGVYVFMSAFLAGTGTATLLALRAGRLTPRQRDDAGAFVLALAIFWAYLFASQYLTIWYGNMPDETVFALRRAEDGWLPVTLAVLALVFAVPFLGLLFLGGRRSPGRLTGILVAQLAGLWLNCHLMVVPSLSPVGSSPFALRDLLIALGVLGAFVLSVAPSLTPQPQHQPGGSTP